MMIKGLKKMREKKPAKKLPSIIYAGHKDTLNNYTIQRDNGQKKTTRMLTIMMRAKKMLKKRYGQRDSG